MARVSAEQFDSHRAAIESAAARLFRQRGLDVSVADVMAAAGLTHGGFYGHFPSKDALAARACEVAFDEAARKWRHRLAPHADPAQGFAALVDGYLSARHRGVAATPCPLAALAVDVAREPAAHPVHHAFEDGVAALLAIIESVTPGPPDEARDTAAARMATLVGGLALARATRGTPLSDRFLLACRQALHEDSRAGADAAHAGPTPVTTAPSDGTDR